MLTRNFRAKPNLVIFNKALHKTCGDFSNFINYLALSQPQSALL
mgnify:CR=1 FL=1